MHYCGRDSHATSRTAIYANITQTGRIRVYGSWFWVVLVGFVGFVGGFGWFWVVLLVVLGGFGWFRVLVTTAFKTEVCNESLLLFSSFSSEADCAKIDFIFPFTYLTLHIS